MSVKILVIEDHPQNRYLFRVLLEHHGYAVTEAATGGEGLTLALEERPDLILLDIQLPDIDGYQVAKRLRDNDALAAIPVVAVTSYAMVGDRDKAIGAGCDGYIEKPINPHTFAEQVAEMLQDQVKRGAPHGIDSHRR